MKTLQWDDDPATREWAVVCNPITSAMQPQYDGAHYTMVEVNWTKYIQAPAYPDYCRHPNLEGRLRPSPNNIIRCWQDGLELEALALTVAWGKMWRTNGGIYGNDLRETESALRSGAGSIARTGSAREAWHVLTSDLGWGFVIASKCIHFLTRSHGFERDPPVTMDKRVILYRVAEKFDDMVVAACGDPAKLGCWDDPDDSWSGYNRYMTAVRCWANLQGWTTTQVESILFGQFYALPTDSPG